MTKQIGEKIGLSFCKTAEIDYDGDIYLEDDRGEFFLSPNDLQTMYDWYMGLKDK